MVRFKVNGEAVSVDATPETPLLWVIREKLNLTGTKFGCGIAQCGACTVHLNGECALALCPCRPWTAKTSPPWRV